MSKKPVALEVQYTLEPPDVPVTLATNPPDPHPWSFDLPFHHSFRVSLSSMPKSVLRQLGEDWLEEFVAQGVDDE